MPVIVAFTETYSDRNHVLSKIRSDRPAAHGNLSDCTLYRRRNFILADIYVALQLFCHLSALWGCLCYFDRQVIGYIGTVPLTAAGMHSMVTLMIKAFTAYWQHIF